MKQFDEVPEIKDEVVLIRVRRGEFEMVFAFKPLKEAVLRRYRQIWSGPPGSRRGGNPGAAIKYLFNETFIEVKDIDISKYVDSQDGAPPEFPSASEFWLKHERAALWTDAAIDGYIGNQRPESDDTKE